ncbi:hypothetical protein C6P45_003372 [Maudiozyma exigua]|uniref:Globin domain-containing protein n=1 Tax=Maudiozyma exigua TaxID=34358 RepID=A0A9P7BCA4_MAUEX|nr:hypothetical protein C6P45_003372 [Kazachstania exigua]
MIDEESRSSIAISNYTTCTDTSVSSLATNDKPFDPQKLNLELYPTDPGSAVALSPINSSLSSGNPSSMNTVTMQNSRLSRTESLFKSNNDDDYNNKECQDVSSILNRPTEKIELKMTKKEKILIICSWNLILNDDLTDNDLKKFSHMASMLEKQPEHEHSYEHKHHISSSTMEEDESSSSDDILNAFLTETNPNKYNSSSFLNSSSSSSRTAPILRDTDFNRKQYDDTNISKSLFCTQFYDNLVNIDQQMEQAYPTLRHQAVSFTILLDSAVQNLNNIKKIDEQLKRTGKRHTRILGIDNGKFEVMGRAFIMTLQDRLGDYFTTELDRLWSQLYSYLADSLLMYGIDPVLKPDLTCETTGKLSTNNSLDFDAPEIVTHQQESTDIKSHTPTLSSTGSHSATRSLTQNALTKIRSTPIFTKPEYKEAPQHRHNHKNTSRPSSVHHSKTQRSNTECSIM